MTISRFFSFLNIVLVSSAIFIEFVVVLFTLGLLKIVLVVLFESDDFVFSDESTTELDLSNFLIFYSKAYLTHAFTKIIYLLLTYFFLFKTMEYKHFFFYFVTRKQWIYI